MSELSLSQATSATAWNVQGDPARALFLAQAQGLFGVALPVVANTTACGANWAAYWLGPRSWLLVATTQADSFTTHREALNDAGGALFDVSASRVAFVVAGEHAAHILAKGCPLDFHPRAFPAGHCAQSLLGHVNALICRQDAPPGFLVMVARSFARDVWRALDASAAQYR